jgi:hypothetical protein
VAAEPQLQSIFAELFTSSGGCELYLKGPQRYGLLGAGSAGSGPLQWAQVAEAARLQGECAVGLLRPGGLLLMGPDLGTQLELSAADRLVVVAEGM